MNIDVYNAQGQILRQLELPDAVFAVEVKQALLHEVVKYQLAKRRQGTAHTKNRSAVRGGGVKPWRQKGTGRARAGSRRSPVWRGGGVAFGPMPRAYAYNMPKAKRRLALCSALSLKMRENDFRVIHDFEIQQPRTRQLLQVIQRFSAQRKILLLTAEVEHVLHLSARNIPDVKVLPVVGLNVYDILHYTTIICAENAVEKIVGRLM